MPGPFVASPHRAKGSWTPRLAGAAVVVVVAGGVLAVYLGTAHNKQPTPVKHQRSSGLVVKVVSVQTVGLVDFGPYDDGDAWPNDADDHPMMLREERSAVDFAFVPKAQIDSGTPDWTANQTTDGSEIFIFVPTGQCLTAAGTRLALTHCDLGIDQRWRPLHSLVKLGQPIAQYANVRTGGCLTASPRPRQARLATCAWPRSKAFKLQEIAFW